jgi:hypothetical protein
VDRDDGRFELYQRIQRKDRFKGADWVISFVATPLNETLFVGSFRVPGVGKVPAGIVDPVGGHDVTGLFFYDLQPDPALHEYAGRIVIDWGTAFRTWFNARTAKTSRSLKYAGLRVTLPFQASPRFRGQYVNLLPCPPHGAERYRQLAAYTCSCAGRWGSIMSDRRQETEAFGSDGITTTAQGTAETRV